MKEYKYEKLLALARQMREETKCNILVLVDEGDDVGAFAAGNPADLRGMLRSLMEEQKAIADVVVEAAGGYIAARVADTAASKQAIKKAYDKTKKPS